MSAFYKFDVIADANKKGWKTIGDNPSINDAGIVAFMAPADDISSTDIFAGPFNGEAIRDITGSNSVSPNSTRAVQINNQNKIVTHDSRINADFKAVTGIRVRYADQPGATQKESFENIVTTKEGLLGKFDDFDTIFSQPSINNNGQVVFSALKDVNRLLATKASSGYNTIPLSTQSAVAARPMIADNGQIVVRFGNKLGDGTTPPSPIKLFDYDLSKSEDIANASMGFTQLGMSPGISDDGQIVTFYGDLSPAGAKTLKLDPGPGIFASIKTSTERKIVRIAGITPNTGNGVLDPGETFIDGGDKNGKIDKGEDKSYFASFDADARVAVNSTQATQRAVTVVYMANDASSNKGIYTNRLNFFGNGVFFDQKKPGHFTVSTPTLVVEKEMPIDGLDGKVEDLNIYDPVNNRDRGDVAFWVKTNNNNNQAVVRARPQEVIFLDFEPEKNFKLQPYAEDIFKGYKVPAKWDGPIAKVFQTLAPNRTDLKANLEAIQNNIVKKVQAAFNDVDRASPGDQRVNVTVLGRVKETPPTDGPFTRVFIGDSPFGLGKGDSGVAWADIFNQNSRQQDNGEFVYEQETPLIFADIIFRPTSNNFSVSLNDPSFTIDKVENAIADVIAHEVGHSLGLKHLEDENLIMNGKPVQGELEKQQIFGNSPKQLHTGKGDDFASGNVENSGARLTFAVGSNADENQLKREPPSIAVLDKENRISYKLNVSLTDSSVSVAQATVGIVPSTTDGHHAFWPELINLGSGDLKTLLERKIEVQPGDKIFLIASTSGSGIDIFGVANDFTGDLKSIDVTNALLVMTDDNIQGDLFNNSGQQVGTSLNLFQLTNTGPVQIGSIGSANAPTNNPPVANNDKTLTVLEDAVATTLGITAPTDTNSDPLTITIDALPETTKGVVRLADNTAVAVGNTLTIDKLTGLVFAPVANANGAAGTFSYTVSDGKGGTDSQIVTLEITPVNDAPLAQDDTATTNQNTPVTIAPTTLLANDSDIDGDALNISNVGNANNGSVVLDQNSNVVFTPAADFTGEATFDYTVSDSNGGSGTAKAIVTVKANSEPEPTPTPTPNPTPTPTPTPIPEPTPIPTPTPNRAPTPIPEPTANPEPTPIPEPTPNPEPTPIPEPTLAPTPNPEPTSIPEPTPTPEPIPTPTPNPEPTLEGIGGETLIGTDNNDLITGRQGDDVLIGKLGNDTLVGGLGNDLLYGNQGEDLLNGNQGNDSLYGGKGNDIVRGGKDNDRVLGDSGDDIVFGDMGNDTVYGGKGNDVVHGGKDDDLVSGDLGNDTLFGDMGNDTVSGGAGDDLLNGGLGNDSLIGGDGRDRFVLNSGTGGDTITDFQTGQDLLGLSSGLRFNQLTISQGTGIQAQDTLIRIASTGELLASLTGLSSSSLTQDMFALI
jgi:Ca2+-binding RTX toxin-like protein